MMKTALILAAVAGLGMTTTAPAEAREIHSAGACTPMAHIATLMAPAITANTTD
jgi:hypothetical protein